MPKKKRILLIACGGTIACTTDDSGAAKQNLTGEKLVQSIPELTNFAEVETFQFRQISSSSITLKDVIELANLISSKDHDGYVITHGTDSIEETAFALDLIYSGSQPIVLTGAMRHASLPSSDGNANVLASVITAADNKSANLGVMVVLNDTVHAARFAIKTHTSRPDAFISKSGGILGWLSENRLIMTSKVERFKLINLELVKNNKLADSNNIPIIKSFSGDDGSLLKLIGESNQYEAIIIDALGGGHVSEQMAKEIEAVTQNMIVVIASRTGEGSTLESTYGSIGSEIDLIDKGAIMAGWFNAIQARILLQLLLASDFSQDHIKDIFKKHVALGSQLTSFD